MNKWELRYHREKKARLEAEHLLENKSRELYKLNQSLEEINKNLEMTIKERTKKYKQARNQAIQTNKNKSEFIANISHDLRSPLHVMIGIAEELSGKLKGSEFEQELTLLLEAGNNQLVLLNEILDLSKIEQGEFILDELRFNLNKLISNVCSMHKVLIRNSNLAFKLELSDNLPNFVIGDENRLRQILTNLLGNSIKHTQVGSIKLVVEIERSTSLLDVIRFTIEDTGKGIEKSKQTNIFNRYVQLQNEEIKGFSGLGLGLSICSELVKLMQGSIHLSSVPGVGSKFWFILPFKKVKEVSDNTIHEQPQTITQDLNVLCVDDEKTNLFLIRSRLKKFGFKITCCENGDVALEKLKKEKFDLIFLDIQMPVLNGYEFLEEANSKNLLRGTLVVVMTANIMRLDKKRLRQLGVNDFLSKPFTSSELEQLLGKYYKKGDDELPGQS